MDQKPEVFVDITVVPFPSSDPKRAKVIGCDRKRSEAIGSEQKRSDANKSERERFG
jgi:hypothetical protein